MAVLILLVATWLNYRQHMRPKVGLNLAMQGLAGAGLPEDGRTFTGRTESVPAEAPVRAPGADEVASGRETIYQGILWMQEKYEQYREQANRRYEQLKGELGRSERRYHELVASIEQVGGGVSGRVMGGAVPAGREEVLAKRSGEIGRREATAGEEAFIGEPANGGGLVAEGGGEVLESQLRTERLKVGELERELHTERLKVEELMFKLQANSQLLMTIYQELDKSLQFERVAN